MTTPLVSCLMVTRDRADLARRAVACFADQTWPRRELVIVDDGDQDYRPMLREFDDRGLDIRYVRRRAMPGVRLGALRNACLDLAAADWCIQWDDDEWYHPERIATQMAATTGTAAVTAVLLRWTLMAMEGGRHHGLAFRADAGIATPGTVLHRRNAARYPNLARGEDSVFLRDLRSAGRVEVLGPDASHLFVRCFHGANTWDETHFLRRLHRRPVDWPSYAAARWWHHDLSRHRACRLDQREQATIDELRRSRTLANAAVEATDG